MFWAKQEPTRSMRSKGGMSNLGWGMVTGVCSCIMLNGLPLLCCLPQYKGRVRINCMAVGGMFVHPDG